MKTIKGKGLILLAAIVIEICIFTYCKKPDIVTQLLSFIFLTIGGEFIPAYCKNKKMIYEFAEKFNTAYYDMYVAYYTMYIRLALLSFSISFFVIHNTVNYIFELLGVIANTGYMIWDVSVSGICSFLIVLLILFKFDRCEFNVIFGEVLKIRKKNFTDEFTESEIQTLKKIH